MRVLTFLALAISLCGCAPAQFNIVKAPAGKTTDQQNLDSTQCGQQSQVSGPWLYGVGNAIYHNMSKNRYQECMNAMGYAVKEKD
jgi:hypothetical protein